jgi:hypothetical protein
MLVDAKLRERFSHYSKITKQTQEQAGKQTVREMLTRAEQDPTMTARLDRVTALQESTVV